MPDNTTASEATFGLLRFAYGATLIGVGVFKFLNATPFGHLHPGVWDGHNAIIGILLVVGGGIIVETINKQSGGKHESP